MWQATSMYSLWQHPDAIIKCHYLFFLKGCHIWAHFLFPEQHSSTLFSLILVFLFRCMMGTLYTILLLKNCQSCPRKWFLWSTWVDRWLEQNSLRLKRPCSPYLTTCKHTITSTSSPSTHRWTYGKRMQRFKPQQTTSSVPKVLWKESRKGVVSVCHITMPMCFLIVHSQLDSVNEVQY